MMLTSRGEEILFFELRLCQSSGVVKNVNDYVSRISNGNGGG